MRKKLSTLTNELKKIKDNPEARSFPQLFEEKLFEIFQLGTPQIIDELLLCFDDEFDYHELMFSIIHTVETFSTDIYVKRVINNLENFYSNSPKWASIIHTRILNSKQTFEAYIDTLKNASLSNKKALNLLLNRMLEEEKNIEIIKKIKELLSCLQIA